MLSFVRNIAVVLTVLVTAGPVLCAASQVSAAPITPEITELIDAQKAVIERMNTPEKGGKLLRLDEPPMRQLLTEGWQLAGKWSGAWLDTHPNPSVKELENLFADFTPPPHDPVVYDPKLPDRYAMAGSATRVAEGVYVVAAAYEESQSANTASTFFVVARDTSGRYSSKWSIKPLAQRHYRKRDEIGPWAFLDSCAYYCGPLIVQKIFPLPSSKGRPRFAIEAYQATNGSTLVKQLSVWQWNGTEAESLAIQSYGLYADDDRGIQMAGNLLIVPTKETTESFSSYGCCAEPRGTWTLRITPDHVQDLGHHFLQPQIHWADRLLAATRAESPAAANFASSHVIAYLRHAEIDADSIDKCHIRSSGQKGAFEISFGSGTKLLFAYSLRKGKPYFTSAHA